MKNKPCKRILSLLLSALILVSMLMVFSVPASAASTANWTVSKVNKAVIAEYTNSQYTSSSRKFTCSSALTDTVKLTNNTGSAASGALSKHYTATIRWSTTAGVVNMTADAGVVTWTDGSYNWFSFNPGQSVYFTLNPNKNVMSTVVFNPNYASLTEISTAAKTLNVLGADHGSVTISGVGAADQVLSSSAESFSQDLDYGTQVTLTAEPDEGYTFYGFCDGSNWYYGGSERTLTFTLQDDANYSVFFYLDSDPMFRVGAKRFADLNDANAAAVASASDKTIILERSGTISSATISAGVSLVIPSADVTEGVWTVPESTGASFVKPTPFRTLTLEPGAELNVEGILSVNGTLKLAQGTQSGPTGTVGEIVLPQGSSINLNGSAVMYTWGYVYGGGDVYANDTSCVYEEMSINDLRGGRATLDMYELNETYDFGCFPFEQYYVQNIESRLHICSTATEYITAGLNISAVFVRSAPFIGPGGVFRLDEGSTLTKYYDSVNDKLVVEVVGDAMLSNLSLSLSVDENQQEGISTGMSFVIDSADYILPINNMWIYQKSGCLTTHYRINLLPDSGLIIDDGAKVLIDSDSEVYIYDVDDLGSYNPKGNLVPLSYSPTLGKQSTRAYANMVDSFVAVNGTLEVKGILNTTQNGANVTSENPKLEQGSYGKVIVHNKSVGSFWGAYQNSNRIAGFDQIPLNPTVLKNSNDTYRPTIARNNDDAEFYYVNLPNITDKDGNPLSVWVSSEDPDYFNVRWVDKDGNVLQTKRVKNTELAVAEYTGQDIPSYQVEENGVVTKFYDCIGWESEYDIDTQTLTYKPRFKEYDAIALIWRNGSTEITRTYIRKLTKMKTSDIPVETINNWSIANLTTDTTYSRYNGFTATINVAGGTLSDYSESSINSYRLSANTVLNIKWQQVTTAQLYTVTWQNESGAAILTKQYFSNQNPVFDGTEPVSSDSSKVFYGWQFGSTVYEKSATLPKPTANQIYTPVFYQKVKVTWANYDGSEISSAYYPKNCSVSNAVYAGATPVREPDAQYTYKFTGWDTHGVTKLTADVTFTAQYTTFLNTWTITWADEDGTELDNDTFYYGSMPAYAGTEPTKAEDDDYVYTFSGWTPELAAVTGDAEYRAAYTASPKGNYVFVEKSLVLNGTIDVKFYFDMPAMAGQKIRFTFLGKTDVQDIEDKGTDDHYSAKMRVCAPEMTDVITAEIISSDESQTYASTTYCVADYISHYNVQPYSDPVDTYIIGNILGCDLWPGDEHTVQDRYQMYVDPENTNQFVIKNVELNAGDELKAYCPTNNAYYGDGYNTSGNNVVISESGVYTIYCYPQNSTYYLSIVKQTGRENHIVSLLRAMDNYGRYAQKYFRNTDPGAHIADIPSYGIPAAADIESTENIKNRDDDFAAVGLKYYGTSLLLDSGTVLRHYFRVVDQALFDTYKDSVTFGTKTVEAQIYTYNGAQGYIYFDLEVPAAELDEAKTIKIGEVEAQFSALDYIKRALTKYEEDPENEDYVKLAELVSALYWYNAYANIYFV